MTKTRGLSILGYNREIDRLEAENERLRAVVDAAKVVQLAMDGDEVDCPFCAYDGLQDAFAALEDGDD